MAAAGKPMRASSASVELPRPPDFPLSQAPDTALGNTPQTCTRSGEATCTTTAVRRQANNMGRTSCASDSGRRIFVNRERKRDGLN